MIKLRKGEVVMEARNDLQASAFLKYGYELITEEVAEPTPASGKRTYSKTDINRMNISDLTALAEELGIEVTEESTGVELKKAIIGKLEL